jgi:hypothetical protein
MPFGAIVGWRPGPAISLWWTFAYEPALSTTTPPFW